MPPRDEVEAALAGLYAELLGVEQVAVRDGFFDLGGHSMVAVRLLGRVRSALGVELPLASLLAGGSVEALAAAVRATREGGQAAGTGDLVEIQPAAGPRSPAALPGPRGRRRRALLRRPGAGAGGRAAGLGHPGAERGGARRR